MEINSVRILGRITVNKINTTLEQKKNIEFLVISNFIMLPITNYKNLSFVINDNTSNVYLFDME